MHIGRRRAVHNGQHSLAVLQAVFQGFGAQQQRQRHGDCAHLQHGHVSHSSFKALRQHNRHTVAALHAQLAQHMAECIGMALQIGIAVGHGVASGALRHDGDTAFGIAFFRPTSAASRSHVEVFWHMPSKTLLHGLLKICCSNDWRLRAGVLSHSFSL